MGFHQIACPLRLSLDATAQFGHLLKIIFHRPGRLKEDKHLTLSLAYFCKSVRNFPWRESRVPWLQMHKIISYFDNKFSFDDVKPLVLIMMKMKRRSSLFLSQGVIDT